MNENDKSRVMNALVKRAVGYTSEETSEEYGLDSDGELKLTKRKVVEKETPADISAAKLLLSIAQDGDLSSLSDEELEELCDKLRKELKNQGGKYGTNRYEV